MTDSFGDRMCAEMWVRVCRIVVIVELAKSATGAISQNSDPGP